jgi:adenosylcobinamide-GDP ribazoletransferase
MNRQLRLFFTALSFYSRLPSPAFVEHDHVKLLPDAIRYLPVVGWIAGLLAAAVYNGATYLFGDNIAILFSMVATVLLTGAFHEDGFADVCDGFGGGWTKEKILDIMKDSRLGTYGVVGIILLVAIKFAAQQQVLAGLPQSFLLIVLMLITAQTLSRFAAITLVFNLNYARIAESKASAAVETGKLLNLVLATLFTLLPLAALIVYTGQFCFAMILIPVLLFARYLGNYFKKWIGGYTGDCLGAVQQLTEVIIYLSFVVLWKFV